MKEGEAVSDKRRKRAAISILSAGTQTSGVSGKSEYLEEDSPSSQFNAEKRKLAKVYYPFIYVDEKKVSKPVVNIQAAIEVCDDKLEDIRQNAKKVENMRFGLFGLEQALFRTVSEIMEIKNELTELLSDMRTTERFNLRLFDQLTSVGEKMDASIELSQNSLQKGKRLRTYMGRNIAKYRVPNNVKEAVGNVIDFPESKEDITTGDLNLISGETTNESRLPWHANIRRRLQFRQAEFSFLLISLWSEITYSNLKPENEPPTSCFAFLNSANSEPLKSFENGPLIIGKRKSGDISEILDSLKTNMDEMGSDIFNELNRISLVLRTTEEQHAQLLEEFNDRRRQLIESLLAMHSAVQALSDMDEKNDALVGKLIKTRPLFSELHEAIVRGSLGEKELSDEDQSFSLLPDLLGPDGWDQLRKNLQHLRLHQNKNTSNYTEDQERESFDSDFSDRKIKYSLRIAGRKFVRRHFH